MSAISRRAIVFSLVACLAGGAAPPAALGDAGAEASDPQPVPAASEVASAEKLIKDIFKSDFAMKSLADRKALALKLLQRARETREPACRFVLTLSSTSARL